MAEAFANQFGLEAMSAGTFPATQVNPLVVEVMKEVGIDVSQSKPKNLNEDMIQNAGIVVLTDASLEKAMPKDLWKKMRKKTVMWNIADPQGRLIEEVRFLRNEIRENVLRLAGK
jgi:protein-tyrosine-phosphatase